jgi:hypothetical protein
MKKKRQQPKIPREQIVTVEFAVDLGKSFGWAKLSFLCL